MLEPLANGATIEEILEHCPALERDDVLAATFDAAMQTSHTAIRVA